MRHISEWIKSSTQSYSWITRGCWSCLMISTSRLTSRFSSFFLTVTTFAASINPFFLSLQRYTSPNLPLFQINDKRRQMKPRLLVTTFFLIIWCSTENKKTNILKQNPFQSDQQISKTFVGVNIIKNWDTFSLKKSNDLWLLPSLVPIFLCAMGKQKYCFYGM